MPTPRKRVSVAPGKPEGGKGFESRIGHVMIHRTLRSER